MKTLLAFAHGQDDPACRFRIAQYVPLLAAAGWRTALKTNRPAHPWETGVRPPALQFLHRRSRLLQRRVRRSWDIRLASGYDVVLVNRDLLQRRLEYEQMLLERNPRVVFDFDDAIYLGDGRVHAGWMCEHAAWVTAGNERLASFARKYTERVTVVPTVVDETVYSVATHEGRPTVRVGWLGSDRSIQETLIPQLAMLARLQSELAFQLVIVTRPRPAIRCEGLKWEFVEWSPHTETRISDLFDIGIMPLTDDPFQRGKCGCKLIQYMAAGLPAIASPVGINTQLIGQDERGFLATTAEDWRDALTTLIRDSRLRAQMGKSGRSFVEREYSRRRWFPVLLEVLERVRVHDGRRVTVSRPIQSGAAAP